VGHADERAREAARGRSKKLMMMMSPIISHFRAYWTWLDEDAHAGAVLVRLDHASQM
jgi:hypothetical protein